MYGSMAPYGASYWGAPPITKEQEIEMLEDQADALERELEEVKKRIQKLKV
jgi:hypothetical protein